MFNLKKYLKKTKYNLTYFFKPSIVLPKGTKKFFRKETKFQSFIYQNCRPNKSDLVDIEGNLKIFGKVTNNYILNKDIFSEFDFKLLQFSSSMSIFLILSFLFIESLCIDLFLLNFSA